MLPIQFTKFSIFAFYFLFLQYIYVIYVKKKRQKDLPKFIFAEHNVAHSSKQSRMFDKSVVCILNISPVYITVRNKCLLPFLSPGMSSLRHLDTNFFAPSVPFRSTSMWVCDILLHIIG